MEDWTYRKTISIQASEVPSDLTNFPVYIDLSADTDLAAHALANARDVVFTADDGTTVLKHEIVGAEPATFIGGAWCWFSDPRAVYYNGKTYFGWVDADGDIMIAQYTHSTEAWSTPVTLHAALQYDDHANPSILIRDSDKKLMVFYTAHNGANFYMRVSTNAEDATAFDAEVDLTPPSA